MRRKYFKDRIIRDRAIRNDSNGLTGLAGELVYNRSTSSYSSSVRFHGLYKVKGYDARRMKKYSDKAQRYLMMLTNAIL